jgi:DNA modification methylase
MVCEIIEGDCLEFLKKTDNTFDLSFVDPPFNQGKDYDNHDDTLDPERYWSWMTEVCRQIYEKTSDGGAK